MRTCKQGNQVTVLGVLPSFILLQVNPVAHLNLFYVSPQKNLCEGRPLLSLIAILKSRDSSIPSAPILNGNGFFSNGNIIKKILTNGYIICGTLELHYWRRIRTYPQRGAFMCFPALCPMSPKLKRCLAWYGRKATAHFSLMTVK